MIRFAREYGAPPILQQPAAKLQPTAIHEDTKGPQAVAQLRHTAPPAIVQQLVAEVPWGHNVVLIEKVKDPATRAWYMQQTIEQGWSRSVLTAIIREVHNAL
jgi:hypothetical protein